MSELLTLRAYARSRRERGLPGGCPNAVYKAIQSGRISRRPDGLIHASTADEEWRKNTLAMGQVEEPAAGSVVSKSSVVSQAAAAAVGVQAARGDRGTPAVMHQLPLRDQEPTAAGGISEAASDQDESVGAAASSELKVVQIQERRAKAELAQLALAKARGQMVSVHDVEATWGASILNARNRLLAMVDDIEDPKTRSILERKLRQILQDLSDSGAAVLADL